MMARQPLQRTQGVWKTKEAVRYHDQPYPRGATVGRSPGGGGGRKMPAKKWKVAVMERPDETRKRIGGQAPSVRKLSVTCACLN